MERVVSVVREGGAVVRLPPGFRFHPTDEELVEQYLRRKVMRRPLPASVVRDVELSKFDPWDLPGDALTGGGFTKERYLFNFREAKYRNGSNRSNRAAGTGYWKATGRDRQVVCSRGDRVIGMKKVLVFHRGKPPHGLRTNWVMHEYRLAASPATTDAAATAPAGEGHVCGKQQPTSNGPMAPTGDWVLCRIFQKRSSSSPTMDDGDGREEVENGLRRGFHDFAPAEGKGIHFIDFLRQRRGNPPQQEASDAEASCVTDVSSVESGEEEGNSLNCSLNLFTRDTR